jgi:signal peptidase II
MKQRDWILVLLPFYAGWALDYFSKAAVLNIDLSNIQFGFLKLILVKNHGAMLGLFSELPSLLRFVSLATLGAFLVVGFFLVQYLLPSRSIRFRIGLSLLMGGIVGNVTDRINRGYVIDFISFNAFERQSPVFNLGDIFQTIGYVLIAYAIVRDPPIYWLEKEKRGTYWISSNYQSRFVLQIVAAAIFLGLICATFAYTYWRISLDSLAPDRAEVARQYLLPFVTVQALICLVYCGFCYAVAKIISHRSAGPIFAFERYVRKSLETPGSQGPLRLRDKDEFKQLELLATEIDLTLQQLSKDKK